MLKIYINNEEVVANNDFTINKHMLNTPSVILNNVCPKEWKENKDYSSFYHPQDYSKCKIQDETYIPAEPGTYTTITGSATIQNVSASKLQEVLQLDGNTTQETTTGRNLFDKSKISSVNNGSNNNGIITSTTNSSVGIKNVVIAFSSGAVSVPANTTIYFSADIKLNSNSTGTFNNINDNVNGGTTKILRPTLSTTYQRYQTSFTYNNSSSITALLIQITNLVGSVEISNIMISTSNNSIYEPYTNGASPNPTYPQPINVVSGRQEVKVVGKNLYDVSKSEIGYINSAGIIAPDQYNLLTDYIKVESGKKYTISVNTQFNNLGYALFDSSKTYSSRQNNNNKTNITITIPNNIEYLRVWFNYNGSTAMTTENILSYQPMIEQSETPTTYEAYKGQSYEINLGKNLFDPTPLKDIEVSGVDITWNNDNTIELNGTYTGTGTLAQNKDMTHKINTNGIMSIQVISGSVSGTFRFNLFDSTRSWYNRWVSVDNTNYCTFTDDYTFNKCNLQFNEGVSFNHFKIGLQVEKGTKTSYAPYKTPIELCKIGNYQDFIKKGTGKNLLDTSTPTTVKNQSGDDRSGYYCRIDKTGRYYLQLNTRNTMYFGKSNNLTQATTLIGSTNATYHTTYDFNEGEYFIIWGTKTDTDLLMVALNGEDNSYEPYGMYNKWYIEKQIGKVVLNGSENWIKSSTTSVDRFIENTTRPGMTVFTTLSNYFKNVFGTTVGTYYLDSYAGSPGRVVINFSTYNTTTIDQFKTWLGTHNTEVYYVLATPTYTEITDSELISQLNSVKLIEGLNNVSITSPYLTAPIYIHYNYVNEETLVDLLFCGVVKNSGKISLNPREPHLTTLQILDFKDFLSSGELDGFVIYQKTILEAIQMVIGNIQDYGFVLGNVNILNPNEVIGAYSTKDKTAYDVFNYLADITQSRWTTRLIDENTVAIDFYDPTLMVEGTAIDYTQSYFENNLIDNMSYNYGSNNYRNKQVMTSNQVYSNISQAQTMVANGYQTQFPTEQPIGKINSIIVDNIPMSFATFNEKDMGYVADFYYQPGDNYIESDNVLTVGQTIIIEYISIVEGRQIITNPLEIDRIEESTGRKGIVSRYETRNDATTSTELQKIGESYIKYKGTPEITITIDSRKNLWEVGQRVEFNAPIEELETEYMVRTKKINYIVSADTLFYTYELVSSFNSETEINYFDNQRAKSKGNIGEGEYISRNIDIESTANIIFYDTETTEVQVDGDNELNSILNSPFIS